MTRIESVARAAGGRIAWSGRDWVRIDGPGRSLRVFPGSRGVDLQLVGADEGTCVGLGFRHGVPLSDPSPEGAPPGVHLRLSAPEELDTAVEELLTGWLAGGGEGNGGGRRLSRRSARAPGRRDR